LTKTKTIWLLICFATALSVVYVMFTISEDMKHQPGSFLREFPPHFATEGNVIDLTYNSYYIAGCTDHHVYLGNYTAPLHMLIANTNLTDSQHVTLKIENVTKHKFHAPKISVDSPDFHLADGSVPIIFSGKVNGWSAKRGTNDSSYFLDIIPISLDTYAFKALGKTVKENLLGKAFNTEPFHFVRTDILKKQVAKDLNQIIYLYYYRNEYLVMDTSLNLIETRNTIDTISKAQIKVVKSKYSGLRTLASPPRITNKLSSISGHLLYVNSSLIARNESAASHDGTAVIDVYDLNTWKYKLSFYIYDYQGSEKLRMFKVAGNHLFALYDNHFQAWELDQKYLEH